MVREMVCQQRCCGLVLQKLFVSDGFTHLLCEQLFATSVAAKSLCEKSPNKSITNSNMMHNAHNTILPSYNMDHNIKYFLFVPIHLYAHVRKPRSRDHVL